MAKKFKEIQLREKTELEPLLAKHPEYIEQGMQIVHEQLPTDSGPLDLLGVDSEGVACVIELKDGAEDEQLYQGIRYYDWVKSNIAWLSRTLTKIDPEQEPRLILIAPEFTPILRKVARYTTLNLNEVLSLKEYFAAEMDEDGQLPEKFVLCKEIDIGEAPEAPEIPTIEKKIGYIQSENIKRIFLTSVEELKNKSIDVRPIGGKGLSGWYKGKRFLHLKTRQQWFTANALESEADSWGSRVKITSDAEWKAFMEQRVEPFLKARDQQNHE